MTTKNHIVELLRSHIAGDDDYFLSVALQAAAHESRKGHHRIADQLRELVDKARSGEASLPKRLSPRPPLEGDLAALLAASYSDTHLASMLLPEELELRLQRIVVEHRQAARLREHGLTARRKILLIGPPGSGKTMTAAALAGELEAPLFTVRFESLMTSYMGETASKLRRVFDAMPKVRGVYFFDEFDAIGSHRGERNDVGEIRRVLNSFLQFLEQDKSDGLIVAATNHPEILDHALFRRFDDVIHYGLPSQEISMRILQTRLSTFKTPGVDWERAASDTEGMSQAEIVLAAEEAAKRAVLSDRKSVTDEDLKSAIAERKRPPIR